MKKLKCSDVGFDCPGVIVADTEEEVLSQATKHALEAHGVTVTPEMVVQIKPLIRHEVEES
jgi:predicted small metal-binding protein